MERLQKVIANAGVCSRRKAEELILQGKVSVNGDIVRTLGTKVSSSDEVLVNGKAINIEKKEYYLLNKPRGYICSASDDKNRKVITELIDTTARIYPVGRLDYDSSGLLLLTNDGSIYNNIIHPRVAIKKKYIAVCKGKFTQSDIKKFKSGIDIGGYVTAEADIDIICEEKSKNSTEILSTVEISIHEGKNRQIRKMCASLNHEVISLKRVSIGNIKLGYLKKGQWRELTESELNYIKNL